jgi:hypothetical protein
MAVGLPLKTTYADGDVYSASDVNDTNGTVNLVGQTTNFFAGKNKIINGDFSINQRAFTSTTSTGFGMDRWLINVAGDGTTTWSIQTFTPGTAPVAGYESTNYSRIVTTGQTSAAVLSRTDQKIENVRTFAGQTVTVSFWAKAATGTPSIAPEFQQVFGTGGSPSATVNAILATTPKQAITTSWARYSFTINIPSISGKTIGTNNDSNLTLGFYVSAGSNFNARTGSLGIQSNTFEIWGVQVESGSTATAFQTATGTIQGELAACQRYYFRLSANSTDSLSVFSSGGFSNTTTTSRNVINLPVTLRTRPSSVDFSNIGIQENFGGAIFAISAITLSADQSGTGPVYIQTTNATSVGSRVVNIMANSSATAYLGFSAEL